VRPVPGLLHGRDVLHQGLDGHVRHGKVGGLGAELRHDGAEFQGLDALAADVGLGGGMALDAGGGEEFGGAPGGGVGWYPRPPS
jgi:hypothetical protein